MTNRFYDKYPHLINENGDNFCWINHVSRGGLKFPSVELIKSIEIIEVVLKKLHGDNLSKIPGVMKYLANIVWPEVSSLNIPKELLQCLV